MFNWFKNTERPVDSAVISDMAVNCWRKCFAECAAVQGARYTSPFFWGQVADLFVVKWREFHPAVKDPQGILEQRCEAYMDWFQDEVRLRIVGKHFSNPEAERIGEFIAVATVRGIEEAIILDAERASLIHDLLPSQWLEAGGFVPEKFDDWYFKMTGKRRVRRNWDF